jgi:anti-sigma B factor antagonist
MELAAVRDPASPGVLHLSGDLDVESASALLEVGLPVIDEVGELVLELSELTFLDSSGLAVLVRLHKRLVDKDAELVLRAPPLSARRILEITNLDEVFVVE